MSKKGTNNQPNKNNQPKAGDVTKQDQLDKPLGGQEQGTIVEGGEPTGEQGQVIEGAGSDKKGTPEPEIKAPVVAVTGGAALLTAKAFAETAQAKQITSSVQSWLDIFENDKVIRTPKRVNDASNSLRTAYIVALTSPDVKENMLGLLGLMHEHKAVFDVTNLYQGTPSTEVELHMAMTQWLHSIAKNPKSMWEDEMASIGMGATRRIAELMKNPSVLAGWEKFLSQVFPE